MTHAKHVSTLKVPGATLYYEVEGSGPLLLIIPGGPQDAGVFAGLSGLLADRYRVVSFDPRGNSRSPFDGEAQPLSLDVQGDDAAALIRSMGAEPAFVFGTSGGAHVALNLAARYPELVRAVLAHEPPTTMLLDDPTPALAADQALYDTYRREGVEAAMGQFFSENGLESGGDDAPPTFEMPPEAQETFARVSGNFEYWLAHGMLPLSHYRPDVEALRSGGPRVHIGIGEESAGQPIEAMSAALARRLGTEPLPFPGDHMGFEMHGAAFAAALDAAFARP